MARQHRENAAAYRVWCGENPANNCLIAMDNAKRSRARWFARHGSTKIARRRSLRARLAPRFPLSEPGDLGATLRNAVSGFYNAKINGRAPKKDRDEKWLKKKLFRRAPRGDAIIKARGTFFCWLRRMRCRTVVP